MKQNVVRLESVKSQSKLILSEPRVFADAQDIADHIKNRRAVVVNDAMASGVAEAVMDAVSGALSGDPGQVRLPAGIEGALVQVGPPDSGLYVIAVDTTLTADDRKLVLAHELQHLRERLLEDVRRNIAVPAVHESEF